MEDVDNHGHNDEDLNFPPLDITKPDGYTGNLVNIVDSAGENIFKIHADGDVYTEEIITKRASIMEGIELFGDAALAFTPEDENGNTVADRTYRFGRNDDIGDFPRE